MYCKNCGNEVNEKAVACLKCGVNPNTEKNFCPSCGVQTNPNQVICTKCGISLASKSFSIDTTALQNIDVNNLLKKPALAAAAVAILACFFNWVSFRNKGLSLFGLASNPMLEQDSILISFLVYLFPLSLIGIIASDFVPQIAKYKKLFSIGSVVLVLYVALGLLLVISKTKILSLGLGFYIGLPATIASAYFSGLLFKNKLNIDASSVQNVNIGSLLKNKIVLGIAAVAIIIGIYFFAFQKSDARKLAELGCKSAKMVQEMNLLNTSVEDIKKFQEEHQKELAEMQQEVVLIQTKYTGNKEFMKEYAEEIQKMDDCPDDVKKAVKSLLKW